MFSQRTTTALLNALQDPADNEAWKSLDDRCRPIMIAVARRVGLDQAEAEDAAQTAMLEFVNAYRAGRYDRQRGRLSAFLITLLRSRAIDARRKANTRRESPAPLEAIERCNPDDLSRLWLDERQSQILTQALDELRAADTDETTLAAFELFAIRGVSIEEVTRSLSISREQVYNAKYRVTQRLQPIIARLDELYEDL